ncbi:MAG: hypothetical protein M1819_000259 [Sarea resinae]|nr:MAG: hypothetical protein M1819_000259 [Sarea resinae]
MSNEDCRELPISGDVLRKSSTQKPGIGISYLRASASRPAIDIVITKVISTPAIFNLGTNREKVLLTELENKKK